MDQRKKESSRATAGASASPSPHFLHSLHSLPLAASSIPFSFLSSNRLSSFLFIFRIKRRSLGQSTPRLSQLPSSHPLLSVELVNVEISGES